MPIAITISKVDGKPGQVYYPLQQIEIPHPTPGPNDVIIKLTAAALNHRDLFIRQHLYPGTTFGVPLFSDGAGIVTATGDSDEAQKWLGKRVLINPGTGWKDDPDGPEDAKGYAILGGTKMNLRGTLAEVVCVDAGEVEEVPGYMSDVEAAALPLTGLTAWRAIMTKSGNARPGRNVLVTGIGGGVALMTLLLANAAGVRVWVSSGSEEKLTKAKELGAAGGIIYKEKDWEKKLLDILPSDRKFLDAIIDGAGGDVVQKGMKLLKHGGVIISYGMTLSPKMDWLMGAVLKNIELKGTTMGSRKEFADMMEFIRTKHIRPIVSRVAQGLELEPIDSLFEEMKKGSQFGKLVVEISKEGASSRL